MFSSNAKVQQNEIGEESLNQFRLKFQTYPSISKSMPPIHIVLPTLHLYPSPPHVNPIHIPNPKSYSPPHMTNTQCLLVVQFMIAIQLSLK